MCNAVPHKIDFSTVRKLLLVYEAGWLSYRDVGMVSLLYCVQLAIGYFTINLHKKISVHYTENACKYYKLAQGDRPESLSLNLLVYVIKICIIVYSTHVSVSNRWEYVLTYAYASYVCTYSWHYIQLLTPYSLVARKLFSKD